MELENKIREEIKECNRYLKELNIDLQDERNTLENLDYYAEEISRMRAVIQALEKVLQWINELK